MATAKAKLVRTHCKYGHSLANNINSRGECRTCAAEYQAKMRVKYKDYRVHDYDENKKVKHPKPKKRVQRTAAEVERLERAQREIDRAVDSKFNIAQPIRILKPGTPEFDEVAKTVTPLERISSEFIMYANLSFEATYA